MHEIKFTTGQGAIALSNGQKTDLNIFDIHKQYISVADLIFVISGDPLAAQEGAPSRSSDSLNNQPNLFSQKRGPGLLPPPLNLPLNFKRLTAEHWIIPLSAENPSGQ